MTPCMTAIAITGGTVYAPEITGPRDVLVAGDKIAGVFPAGAITAGDLGKIFALDVIDARGCVVTPGIVDRHVHILGGGSEGGPVNRVPPLQFSAFVRAGVTSVVGLLGTDGVCRCLPDLLGKARSLEAEGLSSWILTGSYAVPTVTLTGGVQSDLCLIDKVIGVKVAISDHRASHPSVDELRRLVSDARMGGVLAGKSGTVCVHVGAERSGLRPLFDALADTGIPPGQFAPTHVSRDRELLAEALEFTRIGGNIDITAAPLPPGAPAARLSVRDALRFLLDKGVDPRRVSLSSDGNGSMPRWDAQGRVRGMGIGPIDGVLNAILALWDEFPPEILLALGASSPADQLGLAAKGRIEAGRDADALILKDKALKHVIARGRVVMRDGEVVVKGTFE